jgi:hypothetical protein
MDAENFKFEEFLISESVGLPFHGFVLLLVPSAKDGFRPGRHECRA